MRSQMLRLSFDFYSLHRNFLGEYPYLIYLLPSVLRSCDLMKRGQFYNNLLISYLLFSFTLCQLHLFSQRD